MSTRSPFPPGARLPAAWVDLDAFDENARRLAALARRPGLTVRVASKSLRVPALLKRVLASSPVYRGLMCFSAEEAVKLAGEGFDDLLVAYPTLQPAALAALAGLHARGRKVSLVADSAEGLAALEAAVPASAAPFPVLLEPDLSRRVGPLCLGVRRSPLREVSAVVELAEQIRDRHPRLRFQGLMAYEAQVAGLPDRSLVKNPILNGAAALIRRDGARFAARRRAQLAEALVKRGFALEIFNGGGTGSLSWATTEPALTELTAGSGLFAPHIFDGYSNLDLRPALFFALEAVRRPEPGWIACAGGGYVASGEPGVDRLPKPVFPEGAELSPTEGCGEVQTPLKASGADELALGASAVFRPTKAGELAERFNEYHLVRAGRVEGSVPTYRGLGWCFF
jgi:D-serine deaminase-like pyridoxal phosphate-dependent protein